MTVYTICPLRLLLCRPGMYCIKTCRGSVIKSSIINYWVMRWRGWLRHCATSWKVTGSIPNGVIGIFHWHNPSGRTMALGSTQPLTEMSTRNISWGWKQPVRRADNLTTFMCRLSRNLGALTSWDTLGLSRPVMGLLYLYNKLLIICIFVGSLHKCTNGTKQV